MVFSRIVRNCCVCCINEKVISALKSEKESLETSLYETQQVNQQLEMRKEQLEGENQELILKRENLKGIYHLNSSAAVGVVCGHKLLQHIADTLFLLTFGIRS